MGDVKNIPFTVQVGGGWGSAYAVQHYNIILGNIVNAQAYIDASGLEPPVCGDTQVCIAGICLSYSRGEFGKLIQLQNFPKNLNGFDITARKYSCLPEYISPFTVSGYLILEYEGLPPAVTTTPTLKFNIPWFAWVVFLLILLLIIIAVVKI